MDLWYTHAKNLGKLPDEVKRLTLDEIEDSLGFCRAARYRTKPRFVFPEGWVREVVCNDEMESIYDFPGGRLTKISRRSDQQQIAGMVEHIVRYPISSAKDCKAFLDALEHAELQTDIDGFDARDKEVGDAGLPLMILGRCPAHWVMLELMGYEGFFYALADYPELLNQLVSAINSLFKKSLWPPALNSKAELILHGTHFSDQMTPPPIFLRYFAPYFSEFVQRAHERGKRVLWHADAPMSTLVQDVRDLGFDGADCLATTPLVSQTIEDFYDVWQGKIVCWGGIPGDLFNPEHSEEEFQEHLRNLFDFVKGRPGFIIGASDNLLPGALWDRILALRDISSARCPIPEGG